MINNLLPIYTSYDSERTKFINTFNENLYIGGNRKK
jgi:hypothetical protein